MALLIGNSAYQQRPLANPVNDATDLGALLRDAGFVVDVRKNLDLRGFETAVGNFAASLAPGDTALVFYAGHGLESGGVNFLLPVDNATIETESDVKYKSYDASRILDSLSGKGAGLAILILDACRDNPLASRSSGTRGLTVMAAPRQTESVILYSTSPGTTAEDGVGRNSVFMTALLRELPSPELSVRDLFDRVGQTVKLATGGIQVPWMNSTPLSKNFMFFSAAEAEVRAASASRKAGADLEEQRAKVAALEAERGRAKNEAARQKLDIELATARALENTRRLDAERAATEAQRLAQERAKVDSETAARRKYEASEAERTAALKSEADRLKTEYEALSRTDDSAPEFLRQIGALEKALSDIGSRYDAILRDAGKGLDSVYSQKAVALKTVLVMEPWEDEKDFAARTASEQIRLDREKTSEIATYRARLGVDRASQEKDLRVKLDSTKALFLGKTYTLSGSSVLVKVGEFERTQKFWPLHIESADPEAPYSADFSHSIRNESDLASAFRLFDTIVKAGALTGEIEYRYERESGTDYVKAVAQTVRLKDLTTGKVLFSGVREAILFRLSSSMPGRRLGQPRARFESALAGAEVRVDSTRLGACPFDAPLEVGTHRVEFFWPGASGTVNSEITLDYGASPTVAANAGILRLQGLIAGTIVSVDGKPVGTDIGTLVLEPGRRSIGAEIKGYESWGAAVTVLSGQILTINATFVKKKALIEMILVEGGSFMMGSNSGESDEKPVHKVGLSSFCIGKYEVTQAQYKVVAGINPAKFAIGYDADTRPVEQVSWNDAVVFCNKLSDMEGLSSVYTINGNSVMADFSQKGYRLPTEAEWEYAAKGGKQSKGYTYSGSSNIGQVAWYDGNSGSTTHAAGTKAPNELGLYDMSGNVWEWCNDWYGSYGASSQSDPMGASSGNGRVVRGGSWYVSAGNCRSALRGVYGPETRYGIVGFRVVRRP